MKIYGAGMAGLLAGSALRRFSPTIHEAQQELPNNHAALLRFRTDAASQTTRIPFKEVEVHKLISHAGKLYDKPNLKLSNMYSQKVTKKISERSIKSLEPVKRYIAPPDFISQMSIGLDIQFSSPLTKEEIVARGDGKDDPIISTIPMPVMMDLVDWPMKPDFQFATIWSVWGEIEQPEADVYHTVYFPDYLDPYYRVSITGNQFIAEFIKDPLVHYGVNFDANMLKDLSMVLAREFGIHNLRLKNGFEVKEQKYGKLVPIDDCQRKEFIMYLTDQYGIYSLGRFATWRQLLLDDIVDDVKIIEQLIDRRDDYRRTMIGMKKPKF